MWIEPARAPVGGGSRGSGLSEIDAPLKALMLRGLAGDAGAHVELLSRMSVYLRRYFTRKLGSSDADVEDLVQDTLLAIHLKRETWDSAQPFPSSLRWPSSSET